MRFTVATVATAFAIAYWITRDSQSFLWAFLISAAILAMGVGVSLVVGGASRATPTMTYTDDDLEWIESHERFLRDLGRITKGDVR